VWPTTSSKAEADEGWIGSSKQHRNESPSAKHLIKPLTQHKDLFPAQGMEAKLNRREVAALTKTQSNPPHSIGE